MQPDNLEEALRQLRADPGDVSLAATIIDLSVAAKDGPAADAAVGAMRRALEAKSTVAPEEHYMMGTALNATARLAATDLSPEWADDTRCLRTEARTHLFRAAESLEPTLRAMAWTNLGHSLSSCARRTEAFECYVNAYLDGDGHPVGSGWMAVTLHDYDKLLDGGPPQNVITAHHLAKVTAKQIERVAEVAGGQVANKFLDLPTDLATEYRAQPPEDKKSYEWFIRTNRLHLALVVEGVAVGEWDHATLFPLEESGGSLTKGPPMIVAMSNIIKADYLLARRLAHEAFTDRREDAAGYSDTKDGARYGEEFAAHRLALRAAIDCLDRVASAANDYWQFGINPKYVKFNTVFRQSSQELWPPVHHQYREGNWALVALVDLADDMNAPESWIADNKTWRNLATHRFLRAVPGLSNPDLGPVTDLSLEDFERATLQSLTLAKSAYLALLEAVRYSSALERFESKGPGITWGSIRNNDEQ